MLRELIDEVKDEIGYENLGVALNGVEQEWSRMQEAAANLGLETNTDFCWGMIVSAYSTIGMLRELAHDLPAHIDEIIPRIVGVSLSMDHMLNRVEHNYDIV